MNDRYPQSLETLIEELSRLPSIGRKTAQRLAFYILESDKVFANSLSDAIKEAKRKIHFCSQCFHISEQNPCEICSSPQRDRSTLCVVEEPGDVFRIEKSGFYKGLYHVLHGALAPLKGMTPDKLKIDELLERIKSGKYKEVIIATNPSVDGEATALYISDILKSFPVKVTRIGMGIPIGGNLEYVDDITIKKALERRSQYE